MKPSTIVAALFSGALGSNLVSRQGSGAIDTLASVGNQVQNLVAHLTSTVNTIKTPNQLSSALPIIVSDLKDINSTLASLGALGSLNPATVADGASSTGAGSDPLLNLGGILKRQSAGSGLLNPGNLGELGAVTGALTPLVQILGAVLDGITSLTGLKNLTSSLPGDQSDQLTQPLNGILGLVGSILPLGSILGLLHL